MIKKDNENSLKQTELLNLTKEAELEFIKKCIELLVLPNIEDELEKKRLIENRWVIRKNQNFCLMFR